MPFPLDYSLFDPYGHAAVFKLEFRCLYSGPFLLLICTVKLDVSFESVPCVEPSAPSATYFSLLATKQFVRLEFGNILTSPVSLSPIAVIVINGL